MGKFKVSFTTALFVFSFLICVIVAVVFVDRAPRNDYDNFYETPVQTSAAAPEGTKEGGWDPSAPTPTPVTEPPAPVSQVEAILADLPIATHLAGHAQPVPATVTPQATANPMAGRTPEEISRALLGRSGIQAQAESANAVPGMALPEGIATPATAAPATAAPTAASRAYLPLQSNTHESAPGGLQTLSGLGGANPYATAPGGLTNTGNLMGVHRSQSESQQGMMVGARSIETGVQPPAGFSNTPVSAGGATLPSLQSSPASALPGSAEKPLLFPPGSTPAAAPQFQLPPAPTLPPPLIQDADGRRSDAAETPDGFADDASSQAFAISQAVADDESAVSDTDAAVAAATAVSDQGVAAERKPDPEVLAQVNEHVLTKDAAVRFARGELSLNDKKLAKADEEKEAEKVAEQWKKIVAAAELARMEGLSVGISEIEHYASLRPGFEPAAWQVAMEEEGLPAGVIRAHLENIALSEKLVERDFEGEVEEDAIRTAYDKSPSKFASPRKIRLQEIFKAKPSSDERVERVAREMGRLQRQAATGTDFGLLASQVSEAPTSKRGGDLGWIDPAKNKDSRRDKALEGLEPGDVTDVIEEPDGYRIYRLTSVREAAKEFDEAKVNVIAELKKPVRDDTFAAVMEKLEAGEIAPVKSGDRAETAVARVERKGTPVVPTRVGSSLAASLEPEAVVPEEPVQATAESPVAPSPSAVAAAPVASGGIETETEEQKKFVAQELLGQANARRASEERGEVYTGGTEMMQSSAPSTVMHQPGQQTQLLYAPGSVQTMAGGQPAPAVQPGGIMAHQVQDNMQVPNQAVVNYDNSMALTQDQMMQMGSVPPGMMTPPQGGPVAAPQPSAQTHTESNGWQVTKTRVDNNRQTGQAAAAQAAAPSQPSDMGSIPPGFEGAAPSQPPAEPRRGLLGGVRNFFSRN